MSTLFKQNVVRHGKSDLIPGSGQVGGQVSPDQAKSGQIKQNQVTLGEILSIQVVYCQSTFSTEYLAIVVYP